VKVESRTEGDVAILDISGNVDLYHGYMLRDEVRRLLAAGPRYLVFNCRDINYVDSTGLGIFMHSRELARDAGGRVALVSPGPTFQKVITTTQVNRLLPIYDTVEEAVTEIAT